MSLIFEALKKLERERETTERGFQVIAPTPWPARSRAARVAVLSLAAAALGAAGAWATWTFLASRAAAPAAPASVAAGQASARPLPPPIWESPRPAGLAAVPPPTAAAAPRPAAGAPPTAPVAAREPAPAAGAAPPAGVDQLRLEAISAQDGEPVAVINGQLVRKGDTVGGALVTWIGVDSVELEVEGQRRVLTF